MRYILTFLFISVGLVPHVTGQFISAYCKDPAFHAEVGRYLKGTVPVIDVDKLHGSTDVYTILDARETDEFAVSHIPGAIHVGYNHFKPSSIESLDKTRPVVVYCSIGYRSEKIAERLQQRGFTVYNLYGSIFEWANRGHPLVDSEGVSTHQLHAFSKKWSRWVLNPDIARVW